MALCMLINFVVKIMIIIIIVRGIPLLIRVQFRFIIVLLRHPHPMVRR